MSTPPTPPPSPAFPSPPPSPPPNPIYQFVKDLLAKQQDTGATKTLRELTHEHWQSLSTEDMAVLDRLSLNNNFVLLSSFFGLNPCGSSTSCTVVSSHVRHLVPSECTPSEFGLVRLSFGGSGIDAWTHELFDSSARSSTPSGVKIPVDDGLYADQLMIIKNIHGFLHPRVGGNGNQQSNTAWVFIEDDEFDQTRAALEWCHHKSTQLSLALEWKLQCIPIGALAQYLMNVFKDDVSNRFTKQTFEQSAAHKPGPMCSHHFSRQLVLSSPTTICALSKAHACASVLLDKFGHKFMNNSST